MNYVRNATFLIGHVWHQLIVAPRRRKRWRAAKVPFVSSRNGLRFEVHPRQYVDKHIFVDGIYEDRFLHWLDRTLPGGTMLDVGANIGNHALFLRHKFREVHCFEPNPTVIARLRRNLALNDAANIHIHPVGLAAADAFLPFEEVEKSLGQSRFVDTPGAHTSFLQVVRGDAYIASLDIPSIDYIKIDVEGFELQVLEGLAETILKHRPIVSFEYHGQSTDPQVFAAIRRALPGYRIVEPGLEPGKRSFAGKALFYLANANNARLRAVEDPEPRTYQHLVAIPD